MERTLVDQGEHFMLIDVNDLVETMQLKGYPTIGQAFESIFYDSFTLENGKAVPIINTTRT